MDVEIPGIGVFSVRGGIAAVHFDEFLVHSVKVLSILLYIHIQLNSSFFLGRAKATSF